MGNEKKLVFKCIIFFNLFILNISAFGQVSIPSGTTVSISGATTMSLSGDMIIGNGGTLSSDGNLLMQGGNFADSGTALFNSSSRLVYNGNDAQQLYTTAPLPIATLVLNNPTGLAPNNSITIIDSLVLSDGIFYADTLLPVHFANTAANPSENNNSRIVGRAILDTVNAGTAGISFLGCNIAPGSDIGTVSIVRTSGPDAVNNIGSGSSIAQSWLIGSSNPAASGNVTFNWLSALDNSNDMTQIYLYGSSTGPGNFMAITDTAVDVSATDPRTYIRQDLGLNKLFTFSDHNNLGIKTITNPTVRVTAFPNPFGSMLNLSITKDDIDPVQVRMVDVTGKIVLSDTYNAGINTVIELSGLSNLAAGTYLLEVFNNHFGKSLKVVKAN